MPAQLNIGERARASAPLNSPELIAHLHQLECSAQAALSTLRRCLVEKVPPTRSGLAHEAAIAFDLDDDWQALACVDQVAETVGISAFQ